MSLLTRVPRSYIHYFCLILNLEYRLYFNIVDTVHDQPLFKECFERGGPGPEQTLLSTTTSSISYNQGFSLQQRSRRPSVLSPFHYLLLGEQSILYEVSSSSYRPPVPTQKYWQCPTFVPRS